MLASLGWAAAARPLDSAQLDKAKNAVLSELGHAALVEGASVAAYYGALTLVADATGRARLPEKMWSTLALVLGWVGWIIGWIRYLVLGRA